MTVIRPNSISGITSITAQANEINIFRSDGTLAGLQINGINFNNTSGISTLAALNVTGNVSIAGTLTYEDVTNVDSLGIGTFRTGINVSGGQLDVGNNVKIGNAGIITATGLIATSYLSVGDDDTINVGNGNDLKIYHQSSDNNSYIENDTGNLIIRADATDKDITLQSADALIFRAGGSERLHITSDGKVGINSATPATRFDVIQSSASRTWTPGSSVVSMFERGGHCRIAMVAGSSSYSSIDFGDASNDNSGHIKYDHNDNSMSFRTNSNEIHKLRILSDGKIGIGTDPTYGLDIMHNTGIMVRTSQNGVGAAISFTDASTNNWDQIGTIKYFHQNNIVENGIAEGFIIQGTESTTAVKIEGLLRVTAQPCAVVYQCTGPAGGAANAESDNKEPLHFDHVHINQGGMTISQNNARIQVPVTGIYFVSYMVSGTVTTAVAQDGIELVLLRNGNEYPAANSGAEPVFNFGLTANQEEFACSNTLLVSLSKDDYVEVALDNIDDSNANITRGNFNVMLMS